MKKLLYTLLLLPLLLLSQNDQESLIIENVMFSPIDGKQPNLRLALRPIIKNSMQKGLMGLGSIIYLMVKMPANT